MTPFAQRLLEADTAALALVNCLGRGERADLIRHRLADLRAAGARVVLAELAMHPEHVAPEVAVLQVIDLALLAGMSWHDLASTFNAASERRGG